MPKRQGGIGRHPGKKSDGDRKGGARQASLAYNRDQAAAARDVEALRAARRGSKAPATPEAAPMPSEVHAPARLPRGFWREVADDVATDRDRQVELKLQWMRFAKAAEKREARAVALAETRLRKQRKAEESERAWREQLLELQDATAGTEVRWAAGEVIEVSDGTNLIKPGTVRAKIPKGEGAKIHWDDAWEPTKAGGEPVRESDVVLARTKWNPKGVQRAGSWRFDPDCL